MSENDTFTELQSFSAYGNGSDRSVWRGRDWGVIYRTLFLAILFIHLLLILFDAAYLWTLPYSNLTLRDALLRSTPSVVKFYDPMKGIYPHRVTEKYVQQFNDLKEMLSKTKNPDDEEVKPLRESLIQKSYELIDRNEFGMADKSGMFEVVKNHMRRHTDNESAKEAFKIFFSGENLNVDRYKKEMKFFDDKIISHIRLNYFRWIDEDGKPYDRFYRIDLWFVLFYWFDFLIGWFLSIRKREHRRWYRYPLRNWYLIFLLYPPHHAVFFRMLRIIPFYFRLKQSRLIGESTFLGEIVHRNATLISEEISGQVLVQILEQLRTVVQSRGFGGLSFFSDVSIGSQIENFFNEQIELTGGSLAEHVQENVQELASYALHRAFEPWLLSPLGFVSRILLINMESALKDSVEMIFSSPEGQERIKRLARSVVAAMVEEGGKSKNLESMKNHVLIFIDSLKFEVLRTIKEDESRS